MCDKNRLTGHSWEVDKPSAWNNKAVEQMPSVVKCRDCDLTMTLTEATEVEILKNVTGWQKWTALAAIVVALINFITFATFGLISIGAGII